MEYGLYIHIPYCRSICPYCNFVKAPLHRADPERLLQALAREWELCREVDGGSWTMPRTIYVGGGTPTALDPTALDRLLAWIRGAWDLGRVREFTVEANPEGLTRAKLGSLRAAGVNRLSLGIQSFEPAALRALGRIHSAGDGLDAVRIARLAGLANLSVDLMYGVPGETASGLRAGLERVLSLGIPHVSAYPLQVEEGTPFHRKATRGILGAPSEEEAVDRYEELVAVLGRAGYRHYEVSNFALPGYESRHNEGYWTRRPYLGLGPGAHSFDGRERWRNEESIARYFERVESGHPPRVERRELSAQEAAEEGIFLGLRRSRGIRVSRYLGRFGQIELLEWARWGVLGEALSPGPPGRIRPTHRGLLQAHDLAAELFARTDTRGGPPHRNFLGR